MQHATRAAFHHAPQRRKKELSEYARMGVDKVRGVRRFRDPVERLAPERDL